MAERFWPNEDAHRQAVQVLRRRRTTRRSSASPRTASTTASPKSRFRSSISRSGRTTRRRRRCTCAPRLTRPALAGAVRREVREIDPTLSVFNVRTLEDQVVDIAGSRCARTSSAGGLRHPGAAAGVDRPLRRRELLGYRSARARSACGWRSARGAATCSGSCSGTALILVAVGVVDRPRRGVRRSSSFMPAELAAERQRPRSADVRRHGGAAGHRRPDRQLIPALPRDAHRSARRADEPNRPC